MLLCLNWAFIIILLSSVTVSISGGAKCIMICVVLWKVVGSKVGSNIKTQNETKKMHMIMDCAKN